MKKGISLITLIVTIVVIIIISAAVILGMTKNNPIEEGRKAVFLNDLAAFSSELAMYHNKLLSSSLGNYDPTKLNADMTKVTYTGEEKVNVEGLTILDIITSLKESKYKNKVSVVGGQIAFFGEIKQENLWASEAGYLSDVTADGVNKPSMTAGMIPVYFDEKTSTWKKADSNNTDNNWYSYDSVDKKWANVVTVEPSSRSTYQNAAVGTEIPMDQINTMWVWIPRYAYSITGGAYKTVTANSQGKISIKFLVGNSNNTISGENMQEDYEASQVNAGETTPYIVHPAFNFGGEAQKGIWVAKFEVSASVNSNGRYPGNRYLATTANQYGQYPYELEPVQSSTYMQIKPGQPSWRDINVNNIFNQCLAMSQSSHYGLSNADTHMMKNSEWGAVAYLAASSFGQVPTINNVGKYDTWKTGVNDKGEDVISGAHHDIIAGTDNYITKAQTSTTGNVYGIYDMNGGSWEYTAAYLDNNHSYLNNFGKALYTAEEKYKDIYQVSSEEKNNSIPNSVTGTGTITRETLWNSFLSQNGVDAYNNIRKNITLQTLELMKDKKGDALYETVQDKNASFYGKIIGNNGTYTQNWMLNSTVNTAQLARNWDNDYTLIGYAYLPFWLRGGGWSHGSVAGVFCAISNNGSSYTYCGFRPVLCCVSL